MEDFDLVILKDVAQHWDDGTITRVLKELLENNHFVYCVNGFKFGRTPEKNNWEVRDITNKYSYHPLDIEKGPLSQFKPHLVSQKTRRYKQYLLLRREAEAEGK